MSDIRQLSDSEVAFISPYSPGAGGTVYNAPYDETPIGNEDQESFWRPFVTLTYACSLDGMISLSPGVRTTLSGPETKSMTHLLRMHHDAILVGAGTAVADDPSLNCRYPTASGLIQPIVLDPRLRWNVARSKAAALAREGKGKSPWIIHAASIRPENKFADLSVEHISVEVCTNGARPSMEWNSILGELRRRGIKTLMVEGGATVINELLSQPELVDAVIVTIAPTWLGQGGVAASPDAKYDGDLRVNSARLRQTSWSQFGEDAVLCGRLR